MPVHGELPVQEVYQAPAGVVPIVDASPKPPPPVPVAQSAPLQPPPPPPVVNNVTATVGIVTIAKTFLAGFHPVTALIIVALAVVTLAIVLRIAIGRTFRLKN